MPFKSALLLLLLIVPTSSLLAGEPAKPSRYAGLETEKYLGPVEVIVKLDDPKAFTEGPAVDRAGKFYFTSTREHRIMLYDPATKKLSVFREKSNEANGLCFDAQGRLLACEGAAYRVTRTDPKTGKIEVIADKYNGLPLAMPNDVCVDLKGRIYFSSRPSGPADAGKRNANSVYRIDPDGKIAQLLVWPKIHMPNGLDISPDGKTLYVVEAHPDADHHRDIRAYDLSPEGTLSNERVVVDFSPGRSGDGMCVDSAGNLIVAAGLHKTRGTSETLDTKPGIHVFSPTGKLLAFRETPVDTITNCAFGGPDLKTLYVTCGQVILTIRTEIPGKASDRPGE